MNLGALFVSYNSAAHLGAAIEACLRQRPALSEGIIVVDNASIDDSVAVASRYRDVRVIANPENLGFAAAVNQGISAMHGAQAVLLLNPDTLIMDSPALLAAEFSDPRVGVVCGQLIGADGLPQVGFQVRRFPGPASLLYENLGLNRFWPDNRVNLRYRCLDLDPQQPATVEQPAGACLLIRRDVWQALGGLDESYYPLWFEDVDFLRRLSAAGWSARYTPTFRARHAGAHSIGSLGWGERLYYWYDGLLRYSARHLDGPGLYLVAGSVVAAVVGRLITGVVLGQPAQQLRMCARVMSLVGAYLWGDRAGRRKSGGPGLAAG